MQGRWGAVRRRGRLTGSPSRTASTRRRSVENNPVAESSPDNSVLGVALHTRSLSLQEPHVRDPSLRPLLKSSSPMTRRRPIAARISCWRLFTIANVWPCHWPIVPLRSLNTRTRPRCTPCPFKGSGSGTLTALAAVTTLVEVMTEGATGTLSSRVTGGGVCPVGKLRIAAFPS